jgi:hypothetical protein
VVVENPRKCGPTRQSELNVVIAVSRVSCFSSRWNRLLLILSSIARNLQKNISTQTSHNFGMLQLRYQISLRVKLKWYHSTEKIVRCWLKMTISEVWIFASGHSDVSVSVVVSRLLFSMDETSDALWRSPGKAMSVVSSGYRLN